MPDGHAGATSQQSDVNAASQADNPASRLPPLSQAPLLALKADNLRELVLEYLSQSCYVDSAIAFAKEWDHAEGSSTASLNGNGHVGTPSGPSTSRCDSSWDTRSAMPASHASEEQDGDDGDDEMMQSVHGDFHNPPHTSNGHPVVPENGDTTPAYQDRHHRYVSSKHLDVNQVEQIRARKEIKRLIRQGSIQAAIELCNFQFPAVLNTSSIPSSKSSTTTLHPSTSLLDWTRSIPPSAAGSTSLLSFFNRRHPRSGDVSPSVPRYTNNLISKNVPTQSSLLSLSLQIQLFIEIVRSAAPPPAGSSAALARGASISRPSTPLNNAQSPGSANGSMDGSTASLASNTSQGSQASRMSVLSNGSSSSTSAISQALSQAQNLHAQASQIADPTTRSIYLKELEAVSGLLPYRDPRTSPMAFYLDESRRDTLAEAVNGAILLSIGKVSTNSKLENLIRQNDQVWGSLHELKGIYPTAKGANKNDPPKPILPFSMQDFLTTALDDGTVY